MPEYRFYHLQKHKLDQALPGLVRKAYEGGHKILIHCRDENHVKALDKHLWTFHPESFLPHANGKDKNAEQQPVLLDTKWDTPNQASVLIELDRISPQTTGKFDMICLMFEDWDEDRKKAARDIWRELKENPDLELSYWQQSESAG